MLVQSASVQIPNQGGCESEQNGWGQSFCSEMFSLHSCSGKGVDMWLLKKSWKVMHNWPHTTPNKDSNFPTYLKQMNQMVATRTFVGVTSKPRRPTWQKLKLQPSATSPRHCCKGIQICCCWGKKTRALWYFSWGNTLKLLSMLYFPIRRQNNPWTRGPLPHQLGLCGRKTSTSMQYCALFSYR